MPVGSASEDFHGPVPRHFISQEDMPVDLQFFKPNSTVVRQFLFCQITEEAEAKARLRMVVSVEYCSRESG